MATFEAALQSAQVPLAKDCVVSTASCCCQIVCNRWLLARSVFDPVSALMFYAEGLFPATCYIRRTYYTKTHVTFPDSWIILNIGGRAKALTGTLLLDG
jgi:hypothetical protein